MLLDLSLTLTRDLLDDVSPAIVLDASIPFTNRTRRKLSEVSLRPDKCLPVMAGVCRREKERQKRNSVGEERVEGTGGVRSRVQHTCLQINMSLVGILYTSQYVRDR